MGRPHPSKPRIYGVIGNRGARRAACGSLFVAESASIGSVAVRRVGFVNQRAPPGGQIAPPQADGNPDEERHKIRCFRRFVLRLPRFAVILLPLTLESFAIPPAIPIFLPTAVKRSGSGSFSSPETAAQRSQKTSTIKNNIYKQNIILKM